MLPKFRSFVRPITRSFVRSFIQIIFVLPLCCRNSDRSFDHSIVHRSFIVPIHRSSFVHSSYSSFIVRSYDYSPSLFTVTIHHYYSLTLFTIVTIQCYYSSSLLFIIVTTHRWYLVTFSSSLLIITIHRLADHPKFQLLIHHAVQST
jgi:hypothetical protein